MSFYAVALVFRRFDKNIPYHSAVLAKAHINVALWHVSNTVVL